MADNTIQTIPFDYNEIYTEIKNDFEKKGYDMAEGSNTAMLANIQAYLISMLNANTALNINETFLEYANKTQNIQEIARILGYEVKHTTSYVYEIQATIGPGNVIIPHNAKFTGNGNTYYYTGEKLIFRNLKEPTNISLRVKEGTLHSYTDDPDSLDITIGTQITNNQEVPQYYINIPYTNIEDDGIFPYVSYYDDNGIYHDKIPFYRSDEMIFDNDADSERKFIRLDNIEFGTPRIYFKYANMGDGLKIGSHVYLDILESKGAKGELKSLDPKELATDIENFEITDIKLVQGGSSSESNNSVKNNAPKYFNSNNRLVAVNDYEAACNRDVRVKETCVWGGEDEFPLAPGHIWFSFIPSSYTHSFTYDDDKDQWVRNDSDNYYFYGSNEDQDAKQIQYFSHNYLQNSELRCVKFNLDGTPTYIGVWDALNKIRIPTLTFHNRNPIYCEMSYDIEILKYLLTDDKDQIHREIFTIIDNCFTGNNDSTELEKFKQEYFLASIIKRIDKRVTDISGFNITQTNRLVLNTRTLCSEQINHDLLDIYIPLSVPYEDYFDDKGYLRVDLLPNIDTKGFIRYLGEPGGDLYVDWSNIKEDIKNKVTQKDHSIIVAPVKCRISVFNIIEGSEFKSHQLKIRYRIYPNNVNEKDSKNFDYSNLKVYIQKTSNIYSDSLTYELEVKNTLDDGNNIARGVYIDPDNPNILRFGTEEDIKNGDTLLIDYDAFCGFYYLFNSLKHEILVHLFVDKSESGYKTLLYDNLALSNKSNYLYTSDAPIGNYLSSGTREDNPVNEFYLYTEADLDQKSKYIEAIDTTPRSYLYTLENLYLYSNNNYYLTTNGYSVDSPNAIDQYTGPVVREISDKMYYRSPLKSDLFYRNRYLNLKYKTDNFELIKNVIPRLYRVNFTDEE